VKSGETGKQRTEELIVTVKDDHMEVIVSVVFIGKKKLILKR